MKDAGLPFSFISTEFNQIVFNLEDGSDTITSGSAGSYFDEISLVEFEGQPMYRLTCKLIRDPIKNKVMHWEVFILPNGIQFATDSFNTHGEYTYWLASNSIDIMDSIEIFYPMIDVRDTVKIYRIEPQ